MDTPSPDPQPESNTPSGLIRELQSLLPECRRFDELRLQRELARLTAGGKQQQFRMHSRLERMLCQARQSISIRQKRRASLPRPSYPSDLPISQHKDDIVKAIREHQVVVIAGETGSGKTTQIPKMCLEAGLGVNGKIGCTQPRRVAAQSISRRISEEMNTTLGVEVGCKIRFHDATRPESYIKLMTDGILLAETQSDPLLREYEAIIIDEAHERSLNIDFLLGYLKSLLPRRPDLKLLITSATIDTESFSKGFHDAPIIEVSGRMYPVEVRYQPLEQIQKEMPDATFLDATVEAVENIMKESNGGDILIFMPGERDIRETRDLLSGRFQDTLEVVPLFGRLSSAEQQRVFSPGTRRRAVIATNIAETSLTIPRIRYVVDPGLARMSRYSPRTRTKRLPIEPISQSSANQRKGRSGRVSEGVCIRLYSEEDYRQRPAFTQPEIQRANLAEVILRMKAFHLGDIETFPFLHPPQPHAIQGGYQLLQDLGALDADRKLTQLGKELGRLPVDPTIGRMILQSRREHALREVLVIAAGLSIQDPRERPMEAREAADRAHKQFQHPASDFLTLLNLWNRFHAQKLTLSSTHQLRKYCKQQFLSYLRMREWQDIHAQLFGALKELGDWNLNEQDATPEAIHRSILSGLLSHIGHRSEPNLYQLAGNRQAAIFPGSTLHDKTARRKKKLHKQSQPEDSATDEKTHQPPWLVAGEIVETSQLFLRTVAAINPAWTAELGRHLCSRTYKEPRWNRKAGRVLVTEEVRLNGLQVLEHQVPYQHVNPQDATDMFIRDGLVAEDIDAPFPFIAHNRSVRQTIEHLQTRTRSSLLPDLDHALHEFYRTRLPLISSIHELHRLLKQSNDSQGSFLFASQQALIGNTNLSFDSTAFPETIEVGQGKLKVEYAYAPGESHDGATIQIPSRVISGLQNVCLEWAVPGLREEQVAELLRALPKTLRRHLMPFAPKIKEIANQLRPSNHNLSAALSDFVREKYGVEVPSTEWAWNRLPEHLKPRFLVLNEKRKVIVETRDSHRLQEDVMKVRETAGNQRWQKAAAQWERIGLFNWDFGELPERVTIDRVDGLEVPGYPGLEAEAGEVNLRMFKTRTEAEIASRKGFMHLAERVLGRELAWLEKDLRAFNRVAPLYITLGHSQELQESAIHHLKKHLLEPDTVLPLSQRKFEETIASAQEFLRGLAPRFIDQVESILQLRQDLLLQEKCYPGLKQDLAELLPPRFLEYIPYPQIQHLPRYLKAMKIRGERAVANPAKDRQKFRLLKPWVDKRKLLETTLGKHPPFWWLVEEYKVSLFAQELGTAQPVSEKRLAQAWEDSTTSSTSGPS